MKKLNFIVDGIKLKCGCYFTKDGFFYIAPKCDIHKQDLDEGRAFTGVEKE
jgi:hypothetical protein